MLHATRYALHAIRSVCSVCYLPNVPNVPNVPYVLCAACCQAPPRFACSASGPYLAGSDPAQLVFGASSCANRFRALIRSKAQANLGEPVVIAAVAGAGSI